MAAKIPILTLDNYGKKLPLPSAQCRHCLRYFTGDREELRLRVAGLPRIAFVVGCYDLERDWDLPQCSVTL